ncbi:protease complex subunit PrcB family protein [Paenibacillus sp. SORGH_AS_0338]
MGYDPELSIAPADTADQQTVTLTVQLPNPGYSVKITDVKLTDDKRAVISYTTAKPAPGEMNPQVITEGKVTTTIPAGYTPELAK